jgi:hypothetical protein
VTLRLAVWNASANIRTSLLSTFSGYFLYFHENGGSKLVRYVYAYFPSYTASHPARLHSSTISNTFLCFLFLSLLHSLYVISLVLLKPTGHVIHQQFNIQQLYVQPTLYLRVLYLSENKQRLVPLTA